LEGDETVAHQVRFLLGALLLGAGCARSGAAGAEPEPEAIASAWADAYNRHDAEAAALLYREDVVNEQLPWGKAVRGREAMRATYLKVFQAFPDLRVDLEHVMARGDRVVVEWRFSGTQRGEFAGHPPTHRSFQLRGCEVFQIVEGRIQSQQGYWDKASLFEQLGIKP
jgi:steroid delta-isomerase-like uncharacterized protein